MIMLIAARQLKACPDMANHGDWHRLIFCRFRQILDPEFGRRTHEYVSDSEHMVEHELNMLKERDTSTPIIGKTFES